MFFSLEPKADRKNLYDREKELEQLEKFLDHGRIAVVTGVRRIGKTSIVRTFLNDKEKDEVFHILIDCRTFVVSSTAFDKDGFYRALISSVEDLFENKFSKILKSISKVKTPLIEVDIESEPDRRRSVTTILSNVNKMLEKSNRKLIIALDEAQVLRLDGTGGISFLNFLAHIYDFLTNVKVILTGSEVGVLHDLLRLSDVKAPLFGRHVDEVAVQRFSAEDSLNFLVLGSKQAALNPDVEKFRKVVDVLDGLVGYLTLYGFTLLQTGDYDRAFAETLEIAEKMVESELNELFRKSPNYRIVLEAVAHRMDTYSKIKKYFLMNSISINDTTLPKLIKSLVKYSYLEERIENGSKRYVIPDPIVERVMLK
ncbi:AAA family ATPase [Pseudothermotoga sp.]